MKKIYFLRHAKSDWNLYINDNTFKDFDRPLSNKGVNNAKKIGKFIRQKKPIIDCVVCSSSIRTVETLKLIKESLNKTKISIIDELYTFDFLKFTKLIYKFDNQYNNILIIGHNPAMHTTILNFINNNINREKITLIIDKFPTSCLAIVEFEIDDWKKLKHGTGIVKDIIFSKGLKM